MTECTHSDTLEEYVTIYDDWNDTYSSRWVYTERSTCVDIDTGRFTCTKCKKIMYYTGLWKQHWEGKND
jgi:hypothetical protein